MTDTMINLHDESDIPGLPPNAVDQTEDTSPVFLAMCATDKGPEELKIVGTNFESLYGQPNFKKYGQASIQIPEIVANGGRVLFKRIVADDATLGNAIIVAKVANKKVHRTNEQGEKLYHHDAVVDLEHPENNKDEEINTIEAGGTPVYDESCLYRYEVKNVANAKSFNDVIKEAQDLLDEEGKAGEGAEAEYTWFTYPLYVFADNGRGNCNKRIQFVPEYFSCKKLPIMVYTLKVLEDGVTFDSAQIMAEVENTSYKGVDYGFEHRVSGFTQVQTRVFEDAMIAFKSKLSELSGNDEDEMTGLDWLFNDNKKGFMLDGIEYDVNNTVDLTRDGGIALAGGSAGAFENGTQTNPAKETYVQHQLKVLNGEFDDRIFNTDVYFLAGFIDANEDFRVKSAVIDLAEYRQDMTVFLDLGLNINSIEEVQAASERIADGNFIAKYCTVYDIKDPYSRKQITVTMLYDMTSKIVSNIASGQPDTVLAGYRNDCILGAIPGTVRFVPKKTPLLNQKEEMEELRVNYGYYYKEDLVVDTYYTSQKRNSQLSFINNILSTQYVLRYLREYFPKSRYAKMSTTDMSYINDITESINIQLKQFEDWFENLSFEYVPDNLNVVNGIYKAALYLQYYPHAQGEILDIYAQGTTV